MRNRRHIGIIVAVLLLALPFSAVLSGAEEKVAFNVESKKYHCLTCRSAIACTKNCIKVSRSEAKRRGGIPCKNCGGSCD